MAKGQKIKVPAEVTIEYWSGTASSKEGVSQLKNQLRKAAGEENYHFSVYIRELGTMVHLKIPMSAISEESVIRTLDNEDVD